MFLGYGICQSLKGVLTTHRPRHWMRTTVGVFPPRDTRPNGRSARDIYAIPYFQHLGMDWFKRELEKKMPNHEELGVDFRWYMEQLFSGYSRCLLIDTGAGDPVMCEERSREFSDYLGLRLERTNGTLERLRDGLLRSKALARTRTAGRTIHRVSRSMGARERAGRGSSVPEGEGRRAADDALSSRCSSSTTQWRSRVVRNLNVNCSKR